MQPNPMTRNPHAEWRIELARKLAERIVRFQGVRAIVVAGSVAHNYADQYSDLEIPIFWDALPDDDVRQAIVHSLDASFLYGYDGPSAEDQLLIRGVQVDLWHITIAHEEAVIQAVLEGHQADLSSLNAMDTARSCIPLYGHEIIEQWKKQAEAYPEELAQQIIRDHMSSFRIAELFILAARENPTAFYGQLSLLHQEIFLVLLALNRSYFPTYKWLFQALETMQVKPKNIEQRLRRAFATPYAEAIADTKQVLEETLELVERQFPRLDTTKARRQLGYTRSGHLKPVSL
jgi:Domain of unknown function (DUF4037)